MAPAIGGDSLEVLRKKALTRRQILQSAAAGAASAALVTGPSKVARAQEEPAVIYDGGVFDAGGETLRIGSWGGFWEEMERGLILDQMQEEFNCQIQYDGAWPWFPKFVAGGPDNPPLDVTNWNLEELYKTTRAGDFFVPIEEVAANVPNSQDLWPFAYTTGLGITYLFSGYGYGYRTDLVDPAPTMFADFWEERFADKRGTYISSNELFQTFFVMSCLVFGEDEYDIEAGLEAMQKATADEDQRLHRQHANAARARRGRALRPDRLRSFLADRQGDSGRLDVLDGEEPHPDPDEGRQQGQQRDAEAACLRLRQPLRQQGVSGGCRRRALSAADEQDRRHSREPGQQGGREHRRCGGPALDPGLELVRRPRWPG